MLSSYHEACLLNDSYLFSIANNQQQQQQEPFESPPTRGDSIGSGQGSASTSQTSSSGFNGERLNKFWHNLALSLRGKLFVIELNLSRRLRLISSYFSGNRRRRKRRLRKRTNGGCKPPSKSESYQSSSESADFWRSLEEVHSSECLSAQQSLILGRLARVKRTSQRLFSQTADQEPEKEAASSRLGQWLASSQSTSANLFEGGDRKKCRKFKSSSTSPFAAKLRGRGRVSAGKQSNKETPAKGSKDQAQTKLCIVCYERAPNISTLPCGHREICSDCFIEIIYLAVKHRKFPLTCVLCRQRIEKIR